MRTLQYTLGGLNGTDHGIDVGVVLQSARRESPVFVMSLYRPPSSPGELVRLERRWASFMRARLSRCMAMARRPSFGQGSPAPESHDRRRGLFASTQMTPAKAQKWVFQASLVSRSTPGPRRVSGTLLGAFLRAMHRRCVAQEIPRAQVAAMCRCRGASYENLSRITHVQVPGATGRVASSAT